MKIIMLFVVLLFLGISYGADSDIKTVITLMEAYEKQVDSIKLKYSSSWPLIDEEGGIEFAFIKATYAQKLSEGYVLLDETSQRGKKWDHGKESYGIKRSYDGEVTRYLEREKNKHGYQQAAIYKKHDPVKYKTKENPHYYLWGVNYRRKYTDLLNDANAMAEVKGEEVVNGFKTVKIYFKSYNGSVECNLWLLPEKNYIPIKYTSHRISDKSRLQETHLSEFKEIRNGVWYPMTINLYVKALQDPMVIKVEEIDVSPLSKEDFKFEFPAFTHVTDHVIGTSYLTTQPMEQSGIKDAPLVASELSNTQKEVVLDNYINSGEVVNAKSSEDNNDTLMAGSIVENPIRDDKSLRLYYWAALGVVVLLSILFYTIFAVRRKKA